MATADELLTAAYEDVDVLQVDLDARVISIPASLSILGVESDDDVKRLYFKMPRYYGEFDLSEFSIQINFKSAVGGSGDLYPADDVAVDNKIYITFSWLVNRTAFSRAGDVEFNICMKKYDSKGDIVKELNTTTASLPVLKGLETDREIVESNPSAFDAVLFRLYAVEAASGLGKNGYYTIAKVEEYVNGVKLTIIDKDGQTISTIRHGVDGRTPQKGVDYWTPTEVSAVESGIKQTMKTYVDNWAPRYATVVLKASDWAFNTQTIYLQDVKADNIVFVSPAPDTTQYTQYAENGIRCTAVSDGSLTFVCESAPAIDIPVSIAIYYHSDDIGNGDANIDPSEFIKTVNGIKPDDYGNLMIEADDLGIDTQIIPTIVKNIHGISNMIASEEALDISRFEKGSISNGGIDGTYCIGSRARSIGVHIADFDKTIVSANGVTGIYVCLFDENDNYLSSVDWCNNYTIPAGSHYRLILSIDPWADSTVVHELVDILSNFYFVNDHKIVNQVNENATNIGALSNEVSRSVRAFTPRITASNFAELLPSMDNAEPNRIYSVYRTSKCTIENWPEGVSTATFVTLTPEVDKPDSSTYKVQLLFDTTVNKFMFRCNVSSTWKPWVDLGVLEDIVKTAGESVRPFTPRIIASNFTELLPSMDNAEPNRIYSVYRTSKCTIENWPDDVSTATFVTLTPEIDKPDSSTYKVQLLFDTANNKFMFRCNVSNTWKPWNTLGGATTVVTGAGEKIIHVSTNGNDSNDGSSSYPLATFNEAIQQGATTIIAEPGTYKQTISATDVNNLTIRVKKKKYDGSFQDGLNPKIILDSSVELSLMTYDDDYGYEYNCVFYSTPVEFVDGADPSSRLYKVFVSKELPIKDDSPSEAVGYNANLWAIDKNGVVENDIKLVPVLTLDECIATDNTFFFDIDMFFLHCTAYNNKIFMLPPDDDIIANFENCDNLVLEDIQTEYGYKYGINIQNCRNATLNSCNAHHNTNGEGIRLDYTNARLTHCKAYHNRNDGFNMHENGHTELVDCYALYNGDDGVSHHQGCSGTIIGGEYSHNGSGGITPAFGAEVNVYNAIMRDNLYGLQAEGADGYARRTMVAMNNVMTGNKKGGLYIKKNTVIGTNIIHGNGGSQVVITTSNGVPNGEYIDLSNNP